MRIAHEVEAQRVVDVGCGTGSLAVRQGARGFSVTGVDPAVASLDVARAKPHGELVTWVHGDATSLVGIEAADLAVMTGNVAQSCTVTEVALPLVTFEGSMAVGGEVMRSTSTLRFRERDELERDLDRHGFDVLDVRDAPDRPGTEMVFVAHTRDDGRTR